jgi:hypothetical protein
MNVVRVIIDCIFFHFVLLYGWNCVNVCRIRAGLTALMALNILKNMDMRGLVHNSADYLHVLIEVLARLHTQAVPGRDGVCPGTKHFRKLRICASLAVTWRIIVCFFPSAYENMLKSSG